MGAVLSGTVDCDCCPECCESECGGCYGCCFSVGARATFTYSLTVTGVAGDVGGPFGEIGPPPAAFASNSTQLKMVPGDCFWTVDGTGNEGAPNYGRLVAEYHKDTCALFLSPVWRVAANNPYNPGAIFSDGPEYEEYWCDFGIAATIPGCDCCGGTGTIDVDQVVIVFLHDKVSHGRLGSVTLWVTGTVSVSVDQNDCCYDDAACIEGAGNCDGDCLP